MHPFCQIVADARMGLIGYRDCRDALLMALNDECVKHGRKFYMRHIDLCQRVAEAATRR